jgi:hypothetical protein
MAIIMLPQRFQIVSETSALNAGIRLLAFSVTSAIAGGTSNIMSKKARIPFIYTLLLASVLHTVGVAMLSTLPETKHFPVVGYVYEALAGTGVGMTFGILLLATPFVVEPRDLGTLPSHRFLFRKSSDINSRRDRSNHPIPLPRRCHWTRNRIQRPQRYA